MARLLERAAVLALVVGMTWTTLIAWGIVPPVLPEPKLPPILCPLEYTDDMDLRCLHR